MPLIFLIYIACAINKVVSIDSLIAISSNFGSGFGGGRGTSGGGQDNGPPGQNLLGIALAAAAAMLGTPALFHFIGPVVERLIYEAYGVREFASLMYYASFALCGVVIYAACRIALWYAISAIVAFMTMRATGLVAL